MTQLFPNVILPAALSVEDMMEQGHEEREWSWSSNACQTLEEAIIDQKRTFKAES